MQRNVDIIESRRNGQTSMRHDDDDDDDASICLCYRPSVRPYTSVTRVDQSKTVEVQLSVFHHGAPARI